MERSGEINNIMIPESNKIVIAVDNYENEQEMFNAIGDIIKHLTRNQEECFVYADDIECGVYVIAHTHSNRDIDWGGSRFMLVTSGEEDEILQRREEANKEESV